MESEETDIERKIVIQLNCRNAPTKTSIDLKPEAYIVACILKYIIGIVKKKDTFI